MENLVDLFYQEFEKNVEVQIDHSRKYQMQEATNNPYWNYLAENTSQTTEHERPKSYKRVKSADNRLRKNQTATSLKQILPPAQDNYILFLKEDKYYRYDAKKDEWLQDKQDAYSKIVQNSSVVRLKDGTLFCSGGLKVRYDQFKNTYDGTLVSQSFKLLGNGDMKPCQSMDAGRAFHQSIYYKSKIYIIGGYMQPREVQSYFVTNLVECYDIPSNSWTGMKSMRNERVDFSCALHPSNGCIYVVGGRDNDLNILSSVEVYQIASDNWFLLVNTLPINFYKSGLCFPDSNQFIICGGITDDNSKVNKAYRILFDHDSCENTMDYFEMKNMLNKFELEEIEDMIHEDYIDNPQGSLLVSDSTNRIHFIGRYTTQSYDMESNTWIDGKRIIGNYQDMTGYNMFVY